MNFTDKRVRGRGCKNCTTTPLHHKVVKCKWKLRIQHVSENYDTNLVLSYLNTVVGDI